MAHQGDYQVDSAVAAGILVRALRLAQKFTRDELANATGLSPKFISQVEAGKPTAQIGKVLHLLTELGVALHAETALDISPEMLNAARTRRRPRNDNSNS
jgi:transcriptional regulator with XRE-family HTH domain